MVRIWKLLISVLFASLAAKSAYAQSEVPIGIILAGGDIAACFRQTGNSYTEVDPKTNKPRDVFYYEATANLIGRELAAAAELKLELRVLALGDLAYGERNNPRKSYKDCFNSFKTTWGRYQSILLPVLGNHDKDNSGAEAGAVLKSYFASFLRSPDLIDKTSASDSGLYYALDFPQKSEGPSSWLLLGLNSEYAWLKDGPLKDEWTWIENILKNRRERCVIAFMHRPYESTGEHGLAETGTPPSFQFAKIKPFFDRLYNGGVTLLVTGHDHDFEVIAAHRPDGVADEQRGMAAFVVGTGGATLYSVNRPKNIAIPSVGFSSDQHGLLKLVLYSSYFEWTFLSVENGNIATGKEPMTRVNCVDRNKIAGSG